MSGAVSPFKRTQPDGYKLTHLACIPCGDRVEIEALTTDKLHRWVFNHTAHVRAYLETFRIDHRHIWRTSRR